MQIYEGRPEHPMVLLPMRNGNLVHGSGMVDAQHIHADSREVLVAPVSTSQSGPVSKNIGTDKVQHSSGKNATQAEVPKKRNNRPWTAAEVGVLFEFLENNPPFDSTMWEMATNHVNDNKSSTAFPDRALPSCKAIFAKYLNQKKPTGTAVRCELTLWALKIKEKISGVLQMEAECDEDEDARPAQPSVDQSEGDEQDVEVHDVDQPEHDQEGDVHSIRMSGLEEIMHKEVQNAARYFHEYIYTHTHTLLEISCISKYACCSTPSTNT
jgi:hypothetical protein